MKDRTGLIDKFSLHFPLLDLNKQEVQQNPFHSSELAHPITNAASAGILTAHFGMILTEDG